MHLHNFCFCCLTLNPLILYTVLSSKHCCCTPPLQRRKNPWIPTLLPGKFLPTLLPQPLHPDPPDPVRLQLKFLKWNSFPSCRWAWQDVCCFCYRKKNKKSIMLPWTRGILLNRRSKPFSWRVEVRYTVWCFEEMESVVGACVWVKLLFEINCYSTLPKDCWKELTSELLSRVYLFSAIF